MSINSIVHPDRQLDGRYLSKYRLTYKGGRDFIKAYLQYFSKRETIADFNIRFAYTYSPSIAKSLLIEIKNSIFQRLSTVSRRDCVKSFEDAANGLNGGVDLNNTNMTLFINKILDYILPLRKAVVYIDREKDDNAVTKADLKNLSTYMYTYSYENLLNWNYTDGELTKLLLKDNIEVVDDKFGLVTGYKTEFRLLELVNEGVLVTLFDENGTKLSRKLLNLNMIPAVIIDLGLFLLEDIADYQIALLQLASSDLSYALKSNFPFYTEQYHPGADMMRQINMDKESDDQGESKETDSDIHVGMTQGRKYAKDLERPDFIHPSPEPLMASMKKQTQIKDEMRSLLNQRLTELGTRNTIESKEFEVRGLEAGLSQIGLVLERAETRIALIWADYENTETTPSIKYPRHYNLKSDSAIREEAKDLREHLSTIPSKLYQKEVAKEITTLVMGNKLPPELLVEIHNEIDKSEVIITDPEVINQDVEKGLVGVEYASILRGYPKGQVEEAKKDHAERLARINEAQSKAARGISDLDNGGSDSSKEKEKSRNTDNDDVPKDKTRGAGK
jgi:hypothetical protein